MSKITEQLEAIARHKFLDERESDFLENLLPIIRAAETLGLEMDAAKKDIEYADK